MIGEGYLRLGVCLQGNLGQDLQNLTGATAAFKLRLVLGDSGTDSSLWVICVVSSYKVDIPRCRDGGRMYQTFSF